MRGGGRGDKQGEEGDKGEECQGRQEGRREVKLCKGEFPGANVCGGYSDDWWAQHVG